jgi:Transcriptional regulators
MNQQLINYAEEIIDLFRDMTKEFRAQIIKETCAHGLTAPQIMLMHVLYHHPGITLSDLSKRLSLSKSTVSGIVDRLEKSGHVVREIPENNRRIVKISLSPKTSNESYFRNIKTNHLAPVLEKLGLEETEKIVAAFRKLEDAAREFRDKE